MKGIQLLTFITALTAAAGGLVVNAAETVRQIATATFPSVVLLVVEDERGQPVALGSGFFVKENVIASNFHVVENAARAYAKLVGQKTKYDVTGVVGLDSKHDLVLLGVEEAKVPPLKLGDGSKVAVGDTVFAVGNPQGLEGTFSQGIVSGIRQFDADILLQITAPISPGSSGGPVLDSEGRVIGVAVATFRSGQNLNFAIPVKHIYDLVQKAGTPKPLPTATTGGAKSLLDDLGGSKNTDGVTTGNFTYDGYYSTGQEVPFSFSLVNRLRERVKNLYVLVVFHDTDGSPIDSKVIQCAATILPGTGLRVKGSVDVSVAKLNNPRPNPGLSSPPWKSERGSGISRP